MALTPAEAQVAYNKLTHRLDLVADALKPDADGKVRLTKAEASAVSSGLVADVVAFLVDVVD